MRKWGKRAGWAVVGMVGLATGIQLDRFYQAAEQKHASYNYQPAEKPGFLISASTKTPTPHYKPSCNNPNGREDADLCAQWAAVDQVAESNRLNSTNLRIMVLTLFLTIIGTGALVWTLLDTRRTSRAELRAYVYPDEAALLVCAAHGFPAKHPHPDQRFVRMRLKNYGQTPARNVKCQFFAATGPHPYQGGRDETPSDEYSTGDWPPGRFQDMDLEISSSGPRHTRIMKGEGAVYFWGYITYDDIFGRPHRTDMDFVSTDTDYKLQRFQPRKDGENGAT